MVHADLHVHTTVSDGTLAPAAVPAAARAVGLGAVAVTDHDRLAGLAEPIDDRDGLTVIRGIELRVSTDDQRVDLLGYAVRETAALAAELDRLQADRIRRAERMVQLLEARLGVALAVDLSPGVGRPDVARAVVAHPETEFAEPGGVFEALIGADGPCYVPREVTGLDDGLALLADAAALVSLAHPLRYPDPQAALEIAGARSAIDAVELAYPYEEAVDRRPVERQIAEHGLLATGGSDAHGETLGECGLDREAYAAVAERLR